MLKRLSISLISSRSMVPLPSVSMKRSASRTVSNLVSSFSTMSFCALRSTDTGIWLRPTRASTLITRCSGMPLSRMSPVMMREASSL